MSRLKSLVLFWCLLEAPLLRGQDEPPSPPEVVAPATTATVTVDTHDAALTGLVQVNFEFVPYEDFDRAWLVRVQFVNRGKAILDVDHSPSPSTKTWKKDVAVKYSIPCAFPYDPKLPPGAFIDVKLGFVDPGSGKVLGPGETIEMPTALPSLTDFEAPAIEPVESDERVKALVTAARERKGKSSPADAWSILELGIRAATEDRFKLALRDEILSLGHFPPRPISIVEQRIVNQRIHDERERWLRLQSGRFFDQRKYFAARIILEEIGGSLSEKADAAVLGALADAERTQRDLDGVNKAILEFVPDDLLPEVDKAIETLGLTKALYDKAEGWAKKKQYAAARRVLRKLLGSESVEVSNLAEERVKEIEAACLAAVPDAEKAEAQAVLDNPVFARTVAVPSHRFIFIGPKMLVETMNLDGVRRFDLAYVFLTDLFGRLPNPDGDRVTVYFKELWDFGGGVGGGKIIDIGNANPKAKGTGVDNGLLYHELTHCIDDTVPIFEGFREGLANFGAAYAYEMLGQNEDSLHSFRGNLEEFEKEYLARDLEYWRIQNYGPSAGFFLSFAERHAKTKTGHDWKPYRQFFREYREAPVRDGREPYIARALAHYLVRAFGPGAFDDLVKYRFPLTEADRAMIGRELSAFDEESLDPFASGDAFQSFPGSPLPRDLRAGQLIKLASKPNGFETARAYGESELGLIYEWKVIGPFLAEGADPLACSFPPESKIDYADQFTMGNNICLWHSPAFKPPLTLDGTGWVRIEFPYQDDTAIYAYTMVTVDREVDAVAHIRADDDLALFLNGVRIESYLNRGENASTPLQWRGPRRMVADAVRFPVKLRAGKNVVLLKIKNRYGDAGYVFALSHPDGTPLTDVHLSASAEEAAGVIVPADSEPNWKRVFSHSFKNKSFSGKFDVTVGDFKAREGALQGESNARGVIWRKYTVRPGFPKDSPSNLAWLAPEFTKGITDFKLIADFDGTTPPKIVITFQGEGGTDGLSGLNLILDPRGQKVSASLERYDRVVAQAPVLSGSGKEPNRLTLTLLRDRLSLTLGDTVLFDRISIDPIRIDGPPRDRIGFSTWGASARIKSIELLR